MNPRAVKRVSAHEGTILKSAQFAQGACSQIFNLLI